MATVIEFSDPRITETDVENLVTLGNRVAQAKRLYDRVAAAVVDKLSQGGELDPESNHWLQIEVQQGLDGTRQEHLVLDDRRVYTRVTGSKSELKKRRRFP